MSDIDTLRRALLWAGLGAGAGFVKAASQNRPASGVEGAPAGTAANTATPVGPQRALQFPRDFGAHNDLRTEWWYLTGALEAPQIDEQFGFQVTFFRSRTEVPREHPSRFAAKQLLVAHAALTDLKAQRLRHDQRIARWNGLADAQLALASQSDTRIALHGWRLQREGPPGASRYLAQVDARDAAGFLLDLQLAAPQPVLLQGQAGYSRKGPQPQQASYYYSQPQLAVSGHLMRESTQRIAVRGLAWLDHEWSETILPSEAVGWDWIGMNLQDGGALMAFRLRRADGSSVWAGGSHRAAGRGTARDFGVDEVRFMPGRRWTSPATQASYPVEWHIETPVGRYTVRSRLDAQELDSRNSTGTVYWEGLSELLDAGSGRVVGQGYLEMTGYAGRLKL